MTSGNVSFQARSGDLVALARDLRRAGATSLRRELYSGLGRAAKPLAQAVKDSAGRDLPQRGGLAARVAGSSITTRLSAGRTPSLRITARERKGKKIDLAALDRGGVRHPLFGNREHWYPKRGAQPVKPQWFTRPVRDGADAVRAELLKVVDAIEAQIKGR